MVTQVEELVNILRLKLPEYLELHDIKNPLKHFCCIHPDHNDQSPSMNMHRDGTFVKCHACGKSGDIFTVAHWLENKPIVGPEFVEENIFYLANKFGVKYHITHKDDARLAMKYAYLRAYKIASEFITQTASDNPTDGYQKELKKRKWARKESIELGLGCIHEFKDLLNILIANGFSREFIELAGLMRADIFNSDGFLFTIYDEFNRPIAFYSRDVKFEEKKIEYDEKRNKLELITGKPPVKYNSTANFAGIYEKPLFPYGIHDCKNFHKIIVVEGHGCKHSMRLAGIDNVIALGGLELNETTLEKLSKLGVTNICLLLDNDIRGKEKVKNIIRKYFGKSVVEFSIMDMSAIAPDVKDPDEFLRKYTVDAFRTIIEKPCLEWLAYIEMAEKADPYTVLQGITPLIALERSPIARLRIINHLADLTNIARDIIVEEVNQKISASKDRKGEVALRIFEEAKEILMVNPDNVEGALGLLESKLNVLQGNDDSRAEIYSSNEVLRSIVKAQEREESDAANPIIKTGYTEFDQEIQLPSSEAFVLVMGPPNTGKTAFFNSLALRMLESNDDTLVIIFTIDDSRDVYLNRMVSFLSRLKMNWIKRPKFYLDEDKSKLRHLAYKKISDYILNNRLIVKDVTHGDSVEYLGKLISYYRDKNPNKKIVAFCDNFHRMRLESNEEAEGRFKYRPMSGLMKAYTTKYDCCIFSTVEMQKQGMYTKPTNASGIAEAAALQFDANMIIYLWNELNCERENMKEHLYFEANTPEFYPSIGYVNKKTVKPLIEALILKNKLSEFKGSFYFKFHTECAIFDECTVQEKDAISSANASNSKNNPEDNENDSSKMKVVIG